MKTLLMFLTLALPLAGCANSSGNGGRPRTSDLRPSNNPGVSPPGTDVGTSFPGVNQPTDSTTATRSNNRSGR